MHTYVHTKACEKSDLYSKINVFNHLPSIHSKKILITYKILIGSICFSPL